MTAKTADMTANTATTSSFSVGRYGFGGVINHTAMTTNADKAVSNAATNPAVVSLVCDHIPKRLLDHSPVFSRKVGF